MENDHGDDATTHVCAHASTAAGTSVASPKLNIVSSAKKGNVIHRPCQRSAPAVLQPVSSISTFNGLL